MNALEQAEGIIRIYGLTGLTRAEQEARCAVLDRMGTFAEWERVVLIAVGLLGA